MPHWRTCGRNVGVFNEESETVTVKGTWISHHDHCPVSGRAVLDHAPSSLPGQSGVSLAKPLFDISPPSPRKREN